MRDKTKTLASDLVQKATQAGLTIATAESCTGGMVSAAITGISGSSKVFSYGFVTYANEAKIKMLAVPSDLLQQYGAVSETVAVAMAVGALKEGEADLAVSITGIAGPTGGTEAKPVGLVYIGVATKNKSIVRKFLFNGDRDEIRLNAVFEALKMLLDVVI